MDLSVISDEEVKNFSAPILGELIKASNEKNWDAFSSFFIVEGQSPEARDDVKNQWETNPVITSFNQNSVFLGVLRRSDHIVTLWKMRSEKAADDILGFLAFKEVDNDVKVYGFRIK